MGIGSNVVSLQQMELQICEGHALHRHWIVRNIVSGNLHKHMSVREPCEHMTCTTATATHWTPVIVATADQPQPVSRTRPRRGVRYALSDLCAQHKTGAWNAPRAYRRLRAHVRIDGCTPGEARHAPRAHRRCASHTRVSQQVPGESGRNPTRLRTTRANVAPWMFDRRRLPRRGLKAASALRTLRCAFPSVPVVLFLLSKDKRQSGGKVTSNFIFSCVVKRVVKKVSER